MNKKVLLMILDGIGHSSKKEGNAFYQAKTPNLDYLLKHYPHTFLNASGASVGLPKDQMGNSEVGHMNIGAGRIVYTGLSLINKSINDRTFQTNPAFLAAINHVIENESKFHIMGLFSNGGVHSSLEHIKELIILAKSHNLKTILHVFGDGRDVDPKSLLKDLKNNLDFFRKNDVKIATISGRYYSMDRDQRWERSELAYNHIIGNHQLNHFTDPIKYVQDSYDKNITDEFIIPAINDQYNVEEITIADHDAIIFANFRPDRARQLSHLILESKYYQYQPKLRRHDLFFVTMMSYEGITPTMIAYPPLVIKNTLGEVLSKNNLRQLRISETEKYAHVTFFLDGGIETTFPNEKKILINSPKVATYDLKPEMSAVEITEHLLPEMSNNDVIILNFANGDMVGHTGNMKATIKAIETIDHQVGLIWKNALKTKTTLMITADHGNAECMIDHNQIVTKHTTNPVMFILTDKNIKLLKNGNLANIAPTILDYLEIKKPTEMTEKSLIIH